MDIDKALSEIGEIRSQMAGQALFQGFGPVCVACTGVLAGVTALAQSFFSKALANEQSVYLMVWIAVTVICSVFVAAHMWFRANALHGTQSGAMLNRIFEQLVPPLSAVLVITVAFMQFAPSATNALPGLWLMMAALATFSMASSLGNRMRLVGVWYFISGAVVLVLGLNEPLLVMSPWVLGVPFLIGQLAMAAVLKLESRNI